MGAPTQGKRLSSAQLLREYLEYMRSERRKSHNTIVKYSGLCESLQRFLADRGTHLLDATYEELRDWVGRSRPKCKGAEPANSTIHGEVSFLRSVFTYLTVQRELTPRNPALKLHDPGGSDIQPKPVPDDVWRTLWSSVQDANRLAAFGLAYFCGLRRHEVTLLAPWNFTDLPDAMIHEWARKGKKKGEAPRHPWRDLALLYEARLPEVTCGRVPEFIEAVERLRHTREGKPTLLEWNEKRILRGEYGRARAWPLAIINPDQFNEHLDAQLKAAGLPAALFTPHQLRHSFGTNMVRMGVRIETVSEMMGHAKLDMTMRYVSLGRNPIKALLAELGQPEERESLRVARIPRA
jgi:site-specific recombinase XerD